MKLWTDNVGDSAALTPSSEDVEFPATNVQQIQPTKTWNTGSTLATEFLVMDLATAQEITAFIIAFHNLDVTDTNMRLEANTSDSWGAPPFSAAITVVEGEPILLEFAPATFRYWRLVWDKPSAATVRRIGRLYLGKVIDTTDLGDPDYSGFQRTFKDRSNAAEAIGGQEYLEKKNQVQLLAMDLSLVPENIISLYVEIFQRLGKATPFFIQVSELAPLTTLVYCRFFNDFGEKVEAFSGQFYWNTKMQLKQLI